MSALTQDRQMIAVGEEAIAPLVFQPVEANAVIYAGSLVALDSEGYLVPATDATGQIAVGLAQAAYDNTGGSAGAVSLQVRQGVFAFFSGSSGDAIGQAQVGQLCYIIDDQTVGATSAGGTRAVAGTVIQLMSQTFPAPLGGGSTTINYVFVEVGLSRSALAAAIPTPAAIVPTTGATVSWASDVATQSANGIVAAANALAGGFIDDGTNTALIISNTTCTTTSGTITVKPLSKLPAPTGTTVTIVPPASF